MQAYVRLFQERFAAVNNDIVLSNTRAASGPGITWKVCVTNKFTYYIIMSRCISILCGICSRVFSGYIAP